MQFFRSLNKSQWFIVVKVTLADVYALVSCILLLLLLLLVRVFHRFVLFVQECAVRCVHSDKIEKLINYKLQFAHYKYELSSTT